MRRQIFNWKVVGLVLTVIAALSVALPVGAQDMSSPTNSITVTGSGQASGAPDVAYINLGTDTVNADVAQAVQQANDNMAAIIDAIVATGIAKEDIQTVNFNVYPEDRYGADGQPTGERVYHVQNALNVTVRDISQVGTVIDTGLGAGANSVNGLNFGIADTSDLEQSARLDAVADARQRAQQLADAFGVTLGDPIIIQETNTGGTPPPLYAAQASVAGAGGAQITPGQLQVSVQVTVTFAISS